MATYSSILAWKNPWTEESGGLKSVGLHDWACVHEGGGRWVGSNKLVELKKKRERQSLRKKARCFSPNDRLVEEMLTFGMNQFSSVQSLSRVRLFATRQAEWLGKYKENIQERKADSCQKWPQKKVFPSWGSLGWWNMNPKENQLWIFIGRTAAEAEAPLL